MMVSITMKIRTTTRKRMKSVIRSGEPKIGSASVILKLTEETQSQGSMLILKEISVTQMKEAGQIAEEVKSKNLTKVSDLVMREKMTGNRMMDRMKGDASAGAEEDAKRGKGKKRSWLAGEALLAAHAKVINEKRLPHLRIKHIERKQAINDKARKERKKRATGVHLLIVLDPASREKSEVRWNTERKGSPLSTRTTKVPMTKATTGIAWARSTSKRWMTLQTTNSNGMITISRRMSLSFSPLRALKTKQTSQGCEAALLRPAQLQAPTVATTRSAEDSIRWVRKPTRSKHHVL